MQLIRETKLSKKQVEKLLADANAEQVARQQAVALQRAAQQEQEL